MANATGQAGGAYLVNAAIARIRQLLANLPAALLTHLEVIGQVRVAGTQFPLLSI
jgi:hypothetical protein